MIIRTALFRSALSSSFSAAVIGGTLVTGILATSPQISLADSLTDTAPVTRAIGRYDEVVSRAANLYHKTLADARKKLDLAKSKADAAYDRATDLANRDVTMKISAIKESISQQAGFDAHLKDKIKAAAQGFAVSIAKARAIHQASLATALKEYTVTLKSLTAIYADSIKKAETTYRSEARHWIKN